MTLRMRTQAGFTLLEAIVAMVLVGAVMIPLLSFVGMAARGLTTAAETNQRSFAQQAAIAMLEPVNPLIEPRGTLPLDSDVKVSWTSEAVLPPSTDIMIGSPLSGFNFGFYRVTVTLSRPDIDPWFSFEMRKAGYRPAAAVPPP